MLTASKHLKRKTTQNGFTLIEILVVMVLIGILATLMTGSFLSSQKKSRDAKRKSDLKQIGIALEAYYNDKGEYPTGSGGQLLGCANETACDWDETFQDENGTIYMVTLPGDPSSNQEYYYDSDGTEYQIYARLENALDGDVPVSGEDPQVYSNTDCGSDTCNYGISSSNTTVTNGHSLTAD